MLEWLEGGGRVDATYERGGTSGLTLLMGAAHYGHERVVEMMLRRGAEISLQNSFGETALMYSAENGHERVVELLLQHGAEVSLRNSDGYTALMVAAGNGHERVVDLLMRHGAEINVQDSDGYTALMRAPPAKATSGWSSCCCGTARRSTCRAATAAPR